MFRCQIPQLILEQKPGAQDLEDFRCDLDVNGIRHIERFRELTFVKESNS
jgi:hypothetical protein